MTERLEQIVAVTVVTVIKVRHVTRRRGRVVRGVTQDTMGCTATKVRYLLILFRVLFNIDVNEILLARTLITFFYVNLRKVAFYHNYLWIRVGIKTRKYLHKNST